MPTRSRGCGLSAISRAGGGSRLVCPGGMDVWSWPYEVEALRREIAVLEDELQIARAALVEAELMAQLSAP